MKANVSGIFPLVFGPAQTHGPQAILGQQLHMALGYARTQISQTKVHASLLAHVTPQLYLIDPGKAARAFNRQQPV
jgi:hypothetical protein